MADGQKMRVKPADVIAALADESGKCRWLVLRLSEQRAGAVTGINVRSLITERIGPGYDGGALLTQALQARGLVAGLERNATQEDVDRFIAEAGLTQAALLKIYALVPAVESPKIPLSSLQQHIENSIIGSASPMQPEDFQTANRHDADSQPDDSTDAPRP